MLLRPLQESWVTSHAVMLAAFIVLCHTGVVGAQTGVIGGTVLRDSAGHALGDAQVSVPALNRNARTNFNGEFRIGDVPAGRYA